MEPKECCHLGITDEDDVATVAAVAAVWACERLEFLAFDGHTTVATMTGAQVEGDLVNE